MLVFQLIFYNWYHFELFFLERVGELHIIILRRKKKIQNGPVQREPPYGGQTRTYTN
jgi:hypothetical protein